MTEIYGLFDAADPEAPDRVYTSEAFARLFRTIMRDGIVHNDGDELAVSPTVPAAMSVDVGTGMALVQGRYYINDAALALTVEAADPSYPRIDRVVVRADLVGRTVHCVVKKGTAAASPVAPALTRTAEIWELSLAQVRVEAGATSIVAAKITDERANTSLCGVAAPVYVPSSQLEVVGPVDMQGKALTGLPVPSAATDAARRNMGGATLQNLGTPSATTDAATRGYVDGKVAGFGISQVAIDEDKDWGGKAILNAGQIGTQQYFLAPSEIPGHRVYSDLAPSTVYGTSWGVAKTVMVPANQEGVVRVRYAGDLGGTCTWRLTLNGSVVPGTLESDTGTGPDPKSFDQDVLISVSARDVIAVEGHADYQENWLKVTALEIYAIPVPNLAGSGW